jgi:hypothetical protein
MTFGFETAPTGDFNINEFQSLLDRLEASKKRQKRQEAVEGRRNIYTEGLASMMKNF